MNFKLILIAVGLVFAWVWDANAYYFHHATGPLAFWSEVLPFAMIFYPMAAIYLIWKGAKS